MRKTFFGLAILALVVVPAFAGHNEDSTIWVSDVRNHMDSGWVVSIPSGSSDWFSVGHPVVAGKGDSEALVDGLPVTGLSVSTADFGSGTNYPVVGLYPPAGIDPSGNTPDLTSPIIIGTGSVSGTLFDFVDYDSAVEGSIAGLTGVVMAVQFPAGDPGLLGVGADSNASITANSGFTTNGFTSPAIIASFVDFGMNVGQDNGTNSKKSAGQLDGRLRVDGESNPGLHGDTGIGDHLLAIVKEAANLLIGIFCPHKEDKVRLAFAVPPCTAAIFVGPVLPTIPDGDGDGAYLRISTTWPSGFGGITVNFSAVFGDTTVGGHGFTNCITIISKPTPGGGACTNSYDDGSVEVVWKVTTPNGTSDYFSVDHGDCKTIGPNGIVGLVMAPWDFGSHTNWPEAGISPLSAVGPSTPNVGAPYAGGLLAPYTFPAGTQALSSSQFITNATTISGQTTAISWVHMPPGQGGYTTSGLWCGSDASSGVYSGLSGFTQDAYTTPAILFSSANWCFRLITN